MRKRKLLFASLGCVAVCLVGCAVTRAVRSTRLGRGGGERVLIAVQRTEFKLSVAEKAAKMLWDEGRTVETVEVEALDELRTGDYDAIAIANTLRVYRLNGHVRGFLARAEAAEKGKVVLFTTCATPGYDVEVPGVDAITGASRMSEAETSAREIVRGVNEVLSR